jgi:hypothetical protein
MMNEQNDAQLDALEMIAAAQRANRFGSKKRGCA